MFPHLTRNGPYPLFAVNVVNPDTNNTESHVATPRTDNPEGDRLLLELPAKFGFHSGAKGTHTSRTIMLADLETLLASVEGEASNADYRRVITEDNVLGKKTVSTRRLSGQRLTELYGLDADVTLFRILRRLWQSDSASRPLLAILCAAARDPLLRLTASAVLSARQGEIVSKETLEETIELGAPGRFNPSILNKIARNAASSWTQSGHLRGRRVKERIRPNATPAAAAYALVLGYLAGSSGQLLFSTFWTRLLDLPVDELTRLAVAASSRGWITYRQSGSVVEIRFPSLLTPEEKEARSGQD
jgi:hypothetical protein